MLMHCKKTEFSCDEQFDKELFMLFIWKQERQIYSLGLNEAVLCIRG